LVRRIVLWRVGFGWYLFVLLGMPAIVLISTVVVPGANGMRIIRPSEDTPSKRFGESVQRA
jgi:hypothetical protein